jgi:uncharacterized surface protein with fasciclin (FAS1) repeats
MKKRMIAGLSALSLAATLAACGGAPSTTAPQSTTAAGSPAATTAPATNPTVANPTAGANTSGTGDATAYPDPAATTGTTGTANPNATAGTTGTANPNATAGTTGTANPDATAGTTGTANPNATAGTSATTGTSATGVVGTLSADPQFRTLVTLLSSSGLDKQLEAAGPVTIFAPTDQAFAALSPSTLDALAKNPTQLQQILLYHVAPGAIRSTDITSAVKARTLAGEELDVSAANGTVTINGTARVTRADISAGTSVVHSIDTVLVPQSVNLPSAGGVTR